MASVLVGVTDRYYSYAFTVGGAGFRIPVDIAFAPGDIFYSLTRGYEHPPRRNLNCRVKMMGMTDDGEQLITHFGELGSEPGKFTWPAALVLDDDTNVYVLDEYLARVTVFDKDGELLNHWGDVYGSGDGEMNRPSGMARRDDVLFITDSKNHRVQKFSLDGKYIGQFGSHGSGHGQLDSPWGISLDKDGNVFVADWRNDRIQSFTADGEWLATFGRPGTGGDTDIVRHHGGLHLVERTPGEFNRPSGVCVGRRRGHLRGRLAQQPGPDPDCGRQVHYADNRQCRSFQVGQGAAGSRSRFDPATEPGSAGSVNPGEAVVEPQQCPVRTEPQQAVDLGLQPAPVPGVPEEHRVGAEQPGNGSPWKALSKGWWLSRYHRWRLKEQIPSNALFACKRPGLELQLKCWDRRRAGKTFLSRRRLLCWTRLD